MNLISRWFYKVSPNEVRPNFFGRLLGRFVPTYTIKRDVREELRVSGNVTLIGNLYAPKSSVVK